MQFGTDVVIYIPKNKDEILIAYKANLWHNTRFDKKQINTTKME